MDSKRRSSYQATAFPATVMAHLSAVVIFTLLLVWLLHFQGGLAFQSDIKRKIFNLHPLLMTIGLVLISGEAIMAYKTMGGERERQKLVHMILQLMAFVSTIIGLIAVFKFINESGFPNMYTLHSWLGISTVSLFAFQWVSAFFTFWYPGARASARARIMPWHAVIGVQVFFMSVLTAEIGIAEKFIFERLVRGSEAFVLNFVGVFIFIFSLFVSLSLFLPSSTST